MGSQGRLVREQSSLDGIGRRIWRSGGRLAAETRVTIERITESIGVAAHRSSVQAENRLAEVEHRVALLDPARLLARGWSITRTDAGTLVTDPQDVATGTRLLTTVAGGRIASVVDDEEEVGHG